jgi:hypothetical protein
MVAIVFIVSNGDIGGVSSYQMATLVGGQLIRRNYATALVPNFLLSQVAILASLMNWQTSLVAEKNRRGFAC